MAIFFFFQAEDGIRDVAVTGVQTCALPIFLTHSFITWASRSAPKVRKSLRAALRIAGQAGSGSISSMATATERHRRMATRRSLTASILGDERTESSAFSTWSIQKGRSRRSRWAPVERGVTVDTASLKVSARTFPLVVKTPVGRVT